MLQEKRPFINEFLFFGNICASLMRAEYTQASCLLRAKQADDALAIMELKKLWVQEKSLQINAPT
jgi:hypothetical protein